MSNAGTETAARKMKSVNGLEGAGVEFIRPSKLEGPQTLVSEALYVGSKPNNFNDDKLDYEFEIEGGLRKVINGAGNLGYQMAKVPVNSIVTIQYNGKQEIKKGKAKGKLSHNFQVLVAAD